MHLPFGSKKENLAVKRPKTKQTSDTLCAILCPTNTGAGAEAKDMTLCQPLKWHKLVVISCVAGAQDKARIRPPAPAIFKEQHCL